MNYITTTQLRTRSSELIDLLLAGEDISLVHRSKIVGTISPSEEKLKTLTKKDVFDMAKSIAQLNLSPTTPQKRAGNYYLHLKKRYG